MEDPLKSFEQKFQDQSKKVEDQSKKIDDLMNLILELKTQMAESTESPRSGSRQGTNYTPKPLGYVPKLEFPKFDGVNCRLWIKKMQ